MARFEIVKSLSLEKVIHSNGKVSETGVLVGSDLQAVKTVARLYEKNGAEISEPFFGSTEEFIEKQTSGNHSFGFNFNPRMCSWKTQKDQMNEKKPWVNPEDPSKN